MAPRKARETYGHVAEPTLLPEMPSLGTDAPRHADAPRLSAHTHQGAFEFCYIARGSVEWWIRQRVYDVGPGDVYVTKPDEPHGGVNAVLHPCELYWLTVRLPPSGRLAGLAREDGAALARGFHQLQWRCFPGSTHLRDAFERILQEHRAPAPLSGLRARTALHELMITILRDHDAHQARQQDKSQRVSEPVRTALRWLEAHLEADVPIDEVAAHVGLGASRFHERFRDEVGFTPAEWRTRQRIQRAKQLLRSSEHTVTEIAMRCGFNTSQYFATVFKRLVGLTPGQYRARVMRRPAGTSGHSKD